MCLLPIPPRGDSYINITLYHSQFHTGHGYRHKSFALQQVTVKAMKVRKEVYGDFAEKVNLNSFTQIWNWNLVAVAGCYKNS